ncbi:N-acetylmuramoyl-L-alanine amidase [Bacillus sp. FJAT-18019]|uniref:N-acetylmuramoyl-L-alanine amidase n=1 Tax=Paenibacillus solani TaxID=1705565 RepID=A0A0M1N2N8_9BACL|nr:N-acetylmuramoyl-L-alanine amidase CwlD [Paenibacillus solani]KOP66341.1 N-acetylmuramoyl-L-alanine amidase [Bacillus sp. FJAT-18019]KOR76427.1 N-acetylmuramoyl-L-alanine amidase [Paenibacillus solani]
MSRRRSDKVTVWISMKRIQQTLFGALLLALLIIVVTYEIPSAKTSSSTWSLPLAGKIIALDAGHGGPDGGAVSRQGVIEKDVNLAITLYLRDYLQQAGALVILTREGDYDLAAENTKGYSKRKTEDLKQRVRKIEESKADLFLSVHLNSIPSNRWSGAQTFYPPNSEDSKKLAELIQEEIRRNLENTQRLAKTDETIYLLQALRIPSALVEVGFLSHPQESELLRDEKYQRKVAASVYNGILRYSSGESISKSSQAAE